MATWAGGSWGQPGMNRQAFRAWLRTQTKPSFVDFLVVHNTGAPFMLASVGGQQRMKNLENYYRNEKRWRGGPPLFCMGDGLVYPGSPIHIQSVHSPSWNKTSIGSEAEGDFDGTHSPDAGPGKIVWDTMAWCFAEQLDWFSFPADDKHVKLHREDVRTTHACPGKLITKPWFIKKILEAQGLPIPTIPTKPLPTKAVLVDTPGDTLNFRAAPNGPVKGKLPDKTKVLVLEYQGAWARVQSPLGYKGWVFARYLKDVTEPAPAPVPPVVAPVPPAPESQLIQPRHFNLSEYGIEWCKKFEGLGPIKDGRTYAYWDVNDWAIGYGHNNGSGIPPSVKEGDSITLEEADRILKLADVPPIEKYLNHYVKVPLTQYQVDALIWHIFQQGPGNFREGRVLPLVNQGEHAKAAATIEAWPTSNKGLQRRRRVEASRYRGETPTRW